MQLRTPIWIILGMVLLWVGLAANVAVDYIQYQRVTPFSILFLLALLAGYVLPKIFKWPVYTSQPSRPAMVIILALFLVLIIYILVRIFLIKG